MPRGRRIGEENGSSLALHLVRHAQASKCALGEALRIICVVITLTRHNRSAARTGHARTSTWPLSVAVGNTETGNPHSKRQSHGIFFFLSLCE